MQHENTPLCRLGLDIGSTTAKIVVIDDQDNPVFTRYVRHQANIRETVGKLFDEVYRELGGRTVSAAVTGSVGLGYSERLGIPFVQEVSAAAVLVRTKYPEISTIIDIGGEDAKIVYLNRNGSLDLRMNGNCAGGTGAFIDQMAALLGIETGDLDALAARSSQRYPIASRCGVFSKTDIQNLISKNVPKTDIAASVFHAVAVQTVVTLSHGCDITPKILFCGGPLTFLPSLRKAFTDYLKLTEADTVIPEYGNLVPAWGTALSADPAHAAPLEELIALLQSTPKNTGDKSGALPPIFRSEPEYETWKKEKEQHRIEEAGLAGHRGAAYLGIDSGSTTTKIVVTDGQDRLLYTYYAPNNGDPVRAVRTGLEKLAEKCREANVTLTLGGSCSTGYGEDLVRAAFNLSDGIIETIAHFVAARRIDPDVSFILDIGGQDMKAIFVENGVISRMEINEACSSGCGSFLETFANSLDRPVSEFARMACGAGYPCDLGTRCTVFMNSKVKQMLRENASVGDIAAGLSYSVVRNCLYKVLKLRNTDELGERIVLQGGTMRNDSVVRAFEKLTGRTVRRSNRPELMGAYGCALYARANAGTAAALDDLLRTAEYATRQVQCHGCENRCAVCRYTFANGNTFFSGNKCEKIFSNRGAGASAGENAGSEKYALLFDRESRPGARGRIGIPRVLNMYEDYPFWNRLLTDCGFETVLSDPSTFRSYEAGVHTVMSDNICFPAKLVHSHIYDLIGKKTDRIFLPYTVFEKPESANAVNTYNCPIVSGYSDVIRSAVDCPVPIDSPVVTFKETDLLEKCCEDYLVPLGVPKKTVRQAVSAALAAQEAYERQLQQREQQIFEQDRREGRTTILLAGRPYHTDPLVQHKISDLIASMGAGVITEDIVRRDRSASPKSSNLVRQWAYINRILKAAEWAAAQDNDVQFVQTTSFGCGPDAFLLDEVRNILKRHGKVLTILKIDDINNVGSMKLRVRSLLESLKLGAAVRKAPVPFSATKKYGPEDRRRTILAPYFTDYISPLIPALFEVSGYKLENLPPSDALSAEYGLQYANNEVCYPATLIVGDIVKALRSGRYDLGGTAVAITQTGGQCRASNYVGLIKRALTDAGFPQVPVLSVGMGGNVSNEQEGFQLDWKKMLPIALTSILYGDCLSKFYHAAAVREREQGAALRLRDKYLEAAKPLIVRRDSKGLYRLLDRAADDFNAILDPEAAPRPRVGIVGEIFLKFNGFAHMYIADWLTKQRIEVAAPSLLPFFTQSFVNREVRKKTHLEKSRIPDFVYRGLYRLVARRIEKTNRIGSKFRYFMPFTDIYDEAAHGEEAVSLNAQFGEGWLLPAEVVSFARNGVNNVISLQPFGCIANHIVSKGVEKKIKTLYPQLNLLSLDFDGGVSDVNVMNRLLLFVNNLR